jgi:crotonobetainyl-CoA:carnitine CoA-transferase CaiB-like acyl-CoA transferase
MEIPQGSGPLANVRIFDFSIGMAGPWATMLLGSLGAEVLHVEQPDVSWSQLGGGTPPLVNGTSSGYLAWNLNKRSIFLDLKDTDDRRLAHRLIKTCDVFFSNMRVGVPERLGLDYETVRALNPQIVYCIGTGYGTSGPKVADSGNDMTMQALTGFWSTEGERGSPGELYRHYTQIDATTGNTAAQAIVLALFARKRTGQGQRVDISMYDAAATVQSVRIAEHVAGYQHKPRGSAAFGTAPDRAYRCHDHRWIGISVTSDQEWRRLRDCLKADALANESLFATNGGRVANSSLLDEILEPIIASQPQSYWIWAFGRARIPFGIPADFETLKNHRQVLENCYLTRVETDAWGKLWAGGPPWRLSKTPARMAAPPIPGDATFELREELDRTSEEKTG